MISPTKYFENAAAQEIFEFQVCLMSHVGVNEPAQGTQGLRCLSGLEYGKRGVKGVCKGVE